MKNKRFTAESAAAPGNGRTQRRIENVKTQKVSLVFFTIGLCDLYALCGQKFWIISKLVERSRPGIRKM
jgi:hypothetical protein